MPRTAERLTPAAVRSAGDGEHHDGAGLVLRVAGAAASWTLRYTSPAGERRRMGLGSAERDSLPAAARSLKLARELALEARLALLRDADPLALKRERRAAARAEAEAARAHKRRSSATLARVARDYHARVIEPQRSAKHGAQWIASLEQLPAAVWHAQIDEITAPALLDALAAVAARTPETAQRMRQRLESIFADACFRGLCTANPAAATKAKLREVASKPRPESHRALPWREVPDFVRSLREQPGTAARALEFALLTVARTGEVIGATWQEFDASVWTVPAGRMKGGEAHTVHLSERARQLLAEQRALGTAYVFASPMDPARPLSNMAMLTLLRRMRYADRTTVHGLCRASFSTWSNETAAARPDVTEACLAHREADLVRRAYNRAAFTAERAALLEAWCRFCVGESPEAATAPATQRRRRVAGTKETA